MCACVSHRDNKTTMTSLCTLRAYICCCQPLKDFSSTYLFLDLHERYTNLHTNDIQDFFFFFVLNLIIVAAATAAFSNTCVHALCERLMNIKWSVDEFLCPIHVYPRQQISFLATIAMYSSSRHREEMCINKLHFEMQSMW